MTASSTQAPAFQGRIALLGAPIEVGASRRGALMGPAGLRTAGLSREAVDQGRARAPVATDRPAHVRRVLALHDGNIAAAARALGVSRSTVRAHAT